MNKSNLKKLVMVLTALPFVANAGFIVIEADEHPEELNAVQLTSPTSSSGKTATEVKQEYLAQIEARATASQSKIIALNAEVAALKQELKRANLALQRSANIQQNVRYEYQEIIKKVSVHYPTGGTVFKPTPNQKKNTLQAANQSNTIKITGYTDSTGSDKTNIRIAERRALAAKQWMISHGVPADKIIDTKGLLHRYIATNGTAQGRDQNRRVEIEFAK